MNNMNNKIFREAQFSAITLRLTPKSLEWLNGITCGVPHLTIYKDLLYGMSATDSNTTKRGQDVPLKPLEVEASANSFSERWHISRKVMTRLFNEMEQHGLIIRNASKLCSVLTLSAVVDCTPCETSTTETQTNETKAGQQSVVQPEAQDGTSEATSTVPSDTSRIDGDPAHKLTTGPTAKELEAAAVAEEFFNAIMNNERLPDDDDFIQTEAKKGDHREPSDVSEER